MTEEKFEKFIKKSQSVGLTPDEKSGIKRAILVRSEEAPRHYRHGSILNFLTKRRLTAMPILIVIALMFAGGVSAAAQNASPGEALYPVKVSVNERIHKVLAFSEEGKAEVEVKLAAKRLEETEAICQKAEVSAEVLAKIEANFQAHADAVKARIARLEAEGKTEAAADLSANFQTALAAHDRILAMLENDEGCVAEIKVIGPRVEAESKAAHETNSKIELRIKSETSAGVETAAEGKLKAAAHKIAEVQKFIEMKGTEVSAEAKARAEASLKAATDLQAKAEASLEADKFGQAFVEAQQAMHTAQQAKLILTAEARIQAEAKHDAPADDTDDVDDVEDEDDDKDDPPDEHEADVNASGQIKIRIGQ